jgi:hypothetical protein
MSFRDSEHTSEKGVEMTRKDDHRDVPGGLGRLRRPRLLFYGAVIAVAAIAVSSGSAARGSALRTPTSLQAFMKRLGEERKLAAGGIPEFSRTPSFAWAPVRGAAHYDFELATSARFRGDNDLVWSAKSATPAVAIPLALPWITGSPASLYWRVRAVNGNSTSAWSQASPFTMRWPSVPREWKPKPGSAADKPGYVRWHPVDGATAYQVWFVNARKIFTTITNVADEREYYAFHQDQFWTGEVQWRVRAVRSLYGTPKNKLPAVSYGPWSPTYTWRNLTNPLSLASESYPVAAVSDVTSASRSARAHGLMPAFLFAGDGSNNGYGLHRVYVFSDRDCVNVVFKGAIVGGPSYAPRSTGPLDLPSSTEELVEAQGKYLPGGDEGQKTFTADIQPVTTTETRPEDTSATTTGQIGGAATTTYAGAGAKVDLWDRPWPSGRYYWTVVPVEVVLIPPTGGAGGGGAGSDIAIGGLDSGSGSGSDSGLPPGWSVEYHDTLLAQDACQKGLGLQFGKQSIDPQPADNHAVPYATGLAPSGRLLSAGRQGSTFYGMPLVSWAAAPAASAYDVEWSRTRYPWRAEGRRRTFATAALLPLGPGAWWYRVRGVNDSLPGVQAMSWSESVRIKIAAPKFAVIGG